MDKNKIKILPENIANKIAAGEVVQRPESVVKELLENSVDAGARNIDLIVKRAGKVFIQIVDDGEGMTEDDALLSLQRHATSKIFTYEDLEAISTYGFRGEALSSIAAVSQIEIKTHLPTEEVGTYLRTDDGINISKEKGAYPKGTSIIVKNLFFNTPARRNFMKSDATELKHIIETFKREALSQPSISFKLYNDDDLIFDLPAGSKEDRIKAVFAENMLDALVEVKELTDFINMTGYTAKPNFLKKNKGDQYLYVNNRYVISKQINHAVFNAYEHLLEKGDYPFFVLFLDLDPKRVDINVHPSKLEIKFEDERDVYNFVHAVIKKSISSHDLVPTMSFVDNKNENEKLAYNSFVKLNRNDFSDRPALDNKNISFRHTDYNKTSLSDNEIDALFGSLNMDNRKQVISSTDTPGLQEKEYKETEVDATDKTKNQQGMESSFIIQLHNKYILSQIRSGLMIIDQHVAHERILYEKALRAFDANMPFSQQLLFSQTIKVDAGEYAMLKELQPFLTKLGFEIRFFSKDTIVIDGVPQDVKLGTEEAILLDILEEYNKNQKERNQGDQDSLAASFACKAAIKAGDKLSDREMRLLVDQLFATSIPYTCPHGRPIVIKIPLDEFDKRFGRTS
ncbi:MAG: DNA mismatch repair endonuclease MutL [Ignavibacteriales bacterium]|nr:DNA mismatch repair endonuclease MutL [Ignavibacteriales bacterium]